MAKCSRAGKQFFFFFISQGRKKVLIKTVVLSISMFTVSYFKLLKKLCEELEQLITSFLWGQREEETKIQCVG